jgi:hypothetical protein
MPELTAEEKFVAIAELEESQRRLLAAVDGANEEEWRRRPASQGWSIAECFEHITAAELPLPRFFAGPAMMQPSEEERREIRGKDDLVRRVLRDRSGKGESPERIRPKGRFATREEALRTFQDRRAANIAYVRETSEPLRDRFALHPYAGVIDGFQWLLHLAGHTERHAAQIEEIRSALSSGSRLQVPDSKERP